MTPEQFLATHRLFTRAEFQTSLRGRGDRSPDTFTSHLVRWQRLGLIERVKQGVYVRLRAASGGSDPVDFLALASRLSKDAVLAYHTALEAHGVAQSFFERLTFATWTKTKPVRYAGRQFTPVHPPSALARSGRADGWIETMERSGVEVRVTTIERTVVDVLDRPDLAGGLEEVWRSCMSVPAPQLRELESYVTLLGNRTLTAKAGLFLERRSKELTVPEQLLARLQSFVPKGPMYVDRRMKSRFVPNWNLLVPELLLEGAWET